MGMNEDWVLTNTLQFKNQLHILTAIGQLQVKLHPNFSMKDI